MRSREFNPAGTCLHFVLAFVQDRVMRDKKRETREEVGWCRGDPLTKKKKKKKKTILIHKTLRARKITS
jgi:hypothetical protein